MMHPLLFFSIPNDVFRCNAREECSREDHSKNFTIRLNKQIRVDPGQTWKSEVEKATVRLLQLGRQQRIEDPGRTFSKLRVQLRSKSDNSFRSNREELISQVISKEK